MPQYTYSIILDNVFFIMKRILNFNHALYFPMTLSEKEIRMDPHDYGNSCDFLTSAPISCWKCHTMVLLTATT